MDVLVTVRLQAIIEACEELAEESREEAERTIDNYMIDNYMCGFHNGKAAAYEAAAKWLKNVLSGKSPATADNLRKEG